ncbi:MAG: serine/threonine protein kinase, partial [bacterium]|nr:serine/threonine protein kinase [bacterium]
CDAVQHAHQKGVTHRDLKPANIFVVQHGTIHDANSHGSSSGSVYTDEIGQPKVLDFGIARITDADVQMVTLQTAVGQLIGTLAYMSPEQAEGQSANLDTRCDVYALGAVLYELLTGQLPHDLSGRSIADAARIIRENEPTRLSQFGGALRGDVATIVGKAMEKDRDRRYATENALATDLRRYLNDEPIAAR